MADSYKIDQLQDLSGVKRYLRRKFSAEELDALADEAFGKIDESVVISSYGQGGGVTGQMSVPANLLLAAIESIIAEGPGGRQLGTSPDFSGIRMSV
jgi:hypothetical protein